MFWLFSCLDVFMPPRLVARTPRQVMLPDGRSVPMTDAFRAEISEKYSSMAVRPLRCLALAVKVGRVGDFGCCRFVDSRPLLLRHCGWLGCCFMSGALWNNGDARVAREFFGKAFCSVSVFFSVFFFFFWFAFFTLTA